MKDIKGIRGKFLIARLIEEGEHEHQDFKYAISDSRKIARSISAFANNSGGHLLIGVKDNGTIAGVKNEEDIYVVEHAAQSLCIPAQEIEVKAYICEGGLKVFHVEIKSSRQRPVMVREEDNKLKAYFRVKDENIAVSPLVSQAWERKNTQPLTFNEAETRLLHLLEEQPRVKAENYIIDTHVSRRAGEEAIKHLFGMGIIDFEITPGQEYIIMKNR